MTDIRRVGIDLAKKIFHVTTVDENGNVLERKCLRRAGLHSYLTTLPPGCEVGMEACVSAHHWGRLAARLGHRVLIMSPHKVAPYMHRNKNDVNDADGIAEASSRPGMRFVGLKSVNQQYIQQMHRARQMAVKGRTARGPRFVRRDATGTGAAAGRWTSRHVAARTWQRSHWRTKMPARPGRC